MQPKSDRGMGSESLPVPSCYYLPVRVYYEDTDAGGVVYYANYLKFCERARTEWLRALGLSQQALLSEQQLGFVVRSVQADYFAPARLDDALEVRTRIATRRRASLVFDHDILRGDELLFNARVLVACLDMRRLRPTALPASLHALLESQA
jgi:acyl-CoA thioester hydrolase